MAVPVMNLIFLLDVALVIILVLVGWRALASADPFEAITLFVAFGLLMTLSWVRLEALDVALAEAAIGTGFTGALFLMALSRLRRQQRGAGDVGQNSGRGPAP